MHPQPSAHSFCTCFLIFEQIFRYFSIFVQLFSLNSPHFFVHHDSPSNLSKSRCLPDWHPSSVLSVKTLHRVIREKSWPPRLDMCRNLAKKALSLLSTPTFSSRPVVVNQQLHLVAFLVSASFRDEEVRNHSISLGSLMLDTIYHRRKESRASDINNKSWWSANVRSTQVACS